MIAAPDASRSRLRPLWVGVLAAVVLAAGLIIVSVRRPGSAAPAGRSAAGGPPGSPAAEQPTTATTKASPREPRYITEVKAQVSELRGLAWKSPLVVQVVSKDELARRYRAGTQRDRRPERMAGDGDTYRLLHLIPADLDYTKAVDDLFSGLVLGFYDPKTKDLVVGDPGSDDGDADAATRLTLAHELDHALTDQWFDFGTATQALDDADRQEELDAFTALLEGDAKLLESRYTDRYLSEEEQLAAALGALGGVDQDTAAKLADTPKFMLDYLYFPYTTGLAFTQAQAGAGPTPNAGVDAAYRRPPTSTEQILHPELYATDQHPSAPELTDVAGATGCEARRRGSLGEFKMGEVLATELDDDAAASGRKGWNGDVFETVRCGSSLGLVERWEADSDTAADHLARALDQWVRGWSGTSPTANGSFAGRKGSGRIVLAGSRVDLILADDVGTANRLESVTR